MMQKPIEFETAKLLKKKALGNIPILCLPNMEMFAILKAS